MKKKLFTLTLLSILVISHSHKISASEKPLSAADKMRLLMRRAPVAAPSLRNVAPPPSPTPVASSSSQSSLYVPASPVRQTPEDGQQVTSSPATTLVVGQITPEIVQPKNTSTVEQVSAVTTTNQQDKTKITVSFDPTSPTSLQALNDSKRHAFLYILRSLPKDPNGTLPLVEHKYDINPSTVFPFSIDIPNEGPIKAISFVTMRADSTAESIGRAIIDNSGVIENQGLRFTSLAIELSMAANPPRVIDDKLLKGDELVNAAHSKETAYLQANHKQLLPLPRTNFCSSPFGAGCIIQKYVKASN